MPGLTSSCGSPPTPSAPVQPSTPEASCRRFATTYCQSLSKCAPIHFAVDHDSKSTCQARYTDRCLATLAASDVSARSEHIARCARAYDRASCDAPLSVLNSRACTPPPGGRTDGAPCALDEQCASSTCRRDRSRDACGTCGPAFVPGARCGPGGDCGSRLACGPQDKCIRGAALGDPCGLVNGEVVGCRDFGICYRERCVRGAGLDAACDRRNRAAPDCDQLAGLVCASGGRCKEIALAEEGAPCGPGPDGLTACVAGLSCDADEGKCVPRPKPGEPCDLERGLACTFDAECHDGTCVVVDPASCG